MRRAGERARLAELNVYQIAGLAMLASGLTAFVVVFMLRFRRRSSRPGAGTSQSQEPQGHDQRESQTSADQDQARSGQPQFQTEEVPIQPAVDTLTSAEVPHHFTEELIVPGFTETGAEVERQDDTEGRSPQGV